MLIMHVLNLDWILVSETVVVNPVTNQKHSITGRKNKSCSKIDPMAFFLGILIIVGLLLPTGRVVVTFAFGMSVFVHFYNDVRLSVLLRLQKKIINADFTQARAFK